MHVYVLLRQHYIWWDGIFLLYCITWAAINKKAYELQTDSDVTSMTIMNHFAVFRNMLCLG